MADVQNSELSVSSLKEQLADFLTNPKQSDPDVDQLQYMADMIAEMQVMAKDTGLDTLAGILALAVTEARVQLGRRRY